MKTINLVATTARGVETFSDGDEPQNAQYVGSFGTFLYAIRHLLDTEVICYQVQPAGTDGEFEQIQAEFGIH